MQPTLFATESKIEQDFNEFQAKNPRVYIQLVSLARELKSKGHRKIGIGMLFEVIRWQTMLRTYGDVYKLNNNYRSRYARKIMSQEPDLDGFFELRELKS